MSRQTTLFDSEECISLEASGAGNTPSTSPDGETKKSGPAVVRASRSRQPASGKGSKTKGTCGPSFDDSSRSAVLQRSLESKLRARMDVNGSPEYVLTWKHWDMPSGPPICALRGRPRRTSDKDFSGWAAPAATTWGGSAEAHLERKRKAIANGSSMGLVVSCLDQQVQLAGWYATKATDGTKGGPNQTGETLVQLAHLSGWSTTQHCDAKGARLNGYHADLGKDALQSHVPTAKREEFQLNAGMSRWLMGFPATWDAASPNFAAWQQVQERIALDDSADMETQSSPR